MKKLAACLCAFALCLVLAACGGTAALGDGSYTIEADTDSSMFRVEACTLTVDGDTMTATLSLPGEGYSRLYLGSAEDAASAAGTDIYDSYLNGEGLYTFTIPVSVLDEEVQVAAYGHRRDTWYDHTIVFHKPTGDPVDSSAADAVSPAVLQAGEHTVDVTLEGGTGKASIASPAKLTVADDGSLTVTIVWSSSNYDLMVVDGKDYLPVTTDGGSTFEIPVANLDQDLALQAETTAMSQPHLIEYTLHFDSASVK